MIGSLVWGKGKLSQERRTERTVSVFDDFHKRMDNVYKEVKNMIKGRNKRWLVSVAFGLALVMVGGTVVVAAETITLIQRYTTYPYRVKLYEEKAAEFAKEHPNIQVKLLLTPPGEYTKKMLVLFASGTIGDTLWTCNASNHGNFTAKGTLFNLDPYVEADSYDLNQFIPTAIEGLSYKGELYGLPIAYHPGHVGLFYNKDAFDKTGVGYPNWDWTYDDLLEAAKTLTQDFDKDGRIDQWGIYPPTGWAKLVALIRSYGGNMLSKDGGTVLIAEPEAVEAIGFVGDLINKYQVAPSPLAVTGIGVHLTMTQQFAAGLVSMFQSGYWDIGWCRGSVEKFGWGMGPIPAGKGGRQGHGCVDGFSISSTSKHPREAWEWIKFLSSHDTGMKQAKLGVPPSGRQDVWFDPELMKMPEHAVFAKILQTTPISPTPANFAIAEFRHLVDTGLDLVWLGKISPQEGAIQIKAALEKMLEKKI